MNPALRYLLIHRPLGALRRFGRRWQTPRGLFLSLGLILLVGIFVGTQLLISESPDAVSGLTSRRPSPDDLLLFGPPALLFIALIGIRAGGLYFKPAEIQFLFPAPISRVQLLAYNILSRVQIAFLSAVWVSIFTVRYASTWHGGFLAVFALLSFNQLIAQLGGLWLETSRAKAPAPAIRWSRWLAASLLVGAAVAYTLPSASSATGELARTLASHPFVRGVSWLTRPFVELFVADSLGGIALWFASATSIQLVVVGLMLRLDGGYIEALTNRTGPGASARDRRRLAGAAHRAPALGRGPRFRIPIFSVPELRGAGPIAWRQCQELLRNPFGLLRGGLGLLAVVPVVVLRASRGEAGEGLGVSSLVAALLVVPMMVDGADFRRDLDRMSVLKSLPVPPSTIALGQVLPTALLLGFWMLLGAVLILATVGSVSLKALYFLVLLTPPIALITAAIDNWLFLLMPYRIRTRDPGDSTFVGRLTIIMTVKMIVLLFSITLGICMAILTWRFVAESTVLAGLVASATLALCCIPAIGAVTRAFRKFDVADGPPE